MKTPVLFLVFNRPETTQQVFAAIRAARPERLYVAADGPRPERIGEIDRVTETRRIALSVDWPCQVETLVRDSNLGCKLAVSSGIDWFFTKEPEGIVLEDDTVPLASFFRYAEDLLERYRDDERIMMINGCNLIANQYRAPNSYFLSSYAHVWGWASWRRSWAHYDVGMSDWPEVKQSQALRQFAAGSQRGIDKNFIPMLEAVHEGLIDTWDYQWSYALLKRSGLATTPAFNLVRNVGFGAGAAHTLSQPPRYVRRTITAELAWPLKHPSVIKRDTRADWVEERELFDLSWRSQFITRIANFPLGKALLRCAQTCKRIVKELSKSLLNSFDRAG